MPSSRSGNWIEVLENIVTAENLRFLRDGALLSFSLAIGALAIGLLIGTVGAKARTAKNPVARVVATAYVELVRGTPMLLQILFLFLGVPAIWRAVTGSAISMNPFVVGLIAMGINSGAYTTELIRSGIEGVHKGQMEAGRSLGLSYKKTMRFIVLPQAFKRIVPPLVGEFIVLIKDSSLVSVIGAMELIRRSEILGARYFNFIIPLSLAAAMYLVMTLVVSAFARRLERRLKESD